MNQVKTVPTLQAELFSALDLARGFHTGEEQCSYHATGIGSYFPEASNNPKNMLFGSVKLCR